MMTLREAEEVVGIMLTADGGGCKICAEDLIEKFVKEFPKYAKMAQSQFKIAFPMMRERRGTLRADIRESIKTTIETRARELADNVIKHNRILVSK